jgi:hypothetical protein
VLSLEDFLGGLPRFPAAPPGADLRWHGPALGDDRVGLVWGDGLAVGVADDVGGAAAHDGPGPFGEVGGDDADGTEVVFAAFGHLLAVDDRELGVLLAGGVGGADQGGAQQRGAGLGDGLALAVGVPGFGGVGVRPVKERNRLPVANRAGSPMHAVSAGPPMSARGQGAGEAARVHLLVVGLALGGVGGKFGGDSAQQPRFGGDFGGQASEVDGGVAGVKLQRGLGSIQPLAGAFGVLVAAGGLVMTAASRVAPSLSKARGSA